MLAFIASFLLYGLFVPITTRFTIRMGLKRMMVISMPIYALSFAFLIYIDRNPYLLLALHLLTLLIYRLLYWVPYHVDFAKFTDRKTRGRQMSLLRSASTLVLAVTPVVGGVMIGLYGFASLFLAAFVLFLFSIAPIFYMEEVREEFSFGYLETFRRLLSRKHHHMLIAYAGDGMQNAVRIVVWPIFIFGILNERYISVGVVTSLTIFAIIILRLVAGDLADRWDRRKLLAFSAVIYTTGWLLKVFVQTGFQIFLSDTYHNFGNAMNRTSLDVTMYEHAADNGHYVDEYTVLREVAFNLGRVGMLLIALAVFGSFGLTAAFILAALASLSVVLLARENPNIA
jgi:YQGE family putative transporter